MRKYKLFATALLSMAMCLPAKADYVPTEENLKSRQEFSDARFGIFIHWGIYSMFGQGEWYLNYGPTHQEYSKAAKGFYPADFDAKKWVSAIKDAGAKYICITSRHHDGFSMWHTAESDYNIVDATPFKRDILKELADECERQGIRLHFYYSHLDWGREDYPQGRTGHTTGRDASKANWNSYYAFMNRQLTELLTNYGKIGAIWFDGWWDHDSDTTPFDWQLQPQYELIHKLQPGCLVGNNHHQNPFEGEDIQIFERDIPGQNLYGYSEQDISKLPLETCQTMNGMWGYKIKDQEYKDSTTLVRYLLSTAAKGANLLLNIGPQPNGELPAAALDRLRAMGNFMREYGDAVYGTEASPFPDQSWGCATKKGNRLFLHIFDSGSPYVYIPFEGNLKNAVNFKSREKVRMKRANNGWLLEFEKPVSGITVETQIV